MKLQVLRFSSESDSTNGLLLDVTNGVNFLAYNCILNSKEIKVEKKIKIINE